MVNIDLYCIISWDIITYLAKDIGSTIDHICVSKKLVNNLESCKIYLNDHSLDHKFLQSHFFGLSYAFS